jgi:eukaryotic-like serine/threonine-protein kinase
VKPETLVGRRYTVERTLGGGGMAVVYLARDEELDRPVAIKLLAEQLAADEAFRARFLREARLAAGLSHPNIVSVFDAGEEDGRPYIVMECIEGTTLAEELAQRANPYGPEEAVELALQVCAGLEHAHQAGLVHRDVKPQNLLRRADDGIVKIADFGIARSAESTQLTEAGTVLGSAAYLSPEQAAGDEVTAASDIYSFGAVLYQLLTGRTPYRVDSLADLSLMQGREPVKPVRELAPEVPEALEDVVMRCLARDPSYRPASAMALAHELAGASPEPSTQPLPQSAGTRAAEAKTALLRLPKPAFRRGRPLWLALAAFAALIAVIVGIVVAAGDDSDSNPSSPPAVEPVLPGSSPSERAQNLADWIRDHSE